MLQVVVRNGQRWIEIVEDDKVIAEWIPGGFGIAIASEVYKLQEKLDDAQAAARWLYGICTGKLVWCDIQNDDHPAQRWPWLVEDKEGGE